MKKKMLPIFVCTLLFSSSVILAANVQKKSTNHLTSLNTPDDFELLIDCGGFAPWTELYSIHIKSDGETFYLILYPEDRSFGEWTLVSTFNFSDDELGLIWNSIVANDFFNLNNNYSRNSIHGGTFANLTITGNGITHSVQTENIDINQIDEIIKIINSFTPNDYDLYYNALYNHSPEKPSIISGPSNGSVRTEYSFTTTTYDIDGDQIYYFFDWGDDSNGGWIGPYEPDNNVTAQHTWSRKGNYNVKVKSIDDPNGDGDLSDGMESDWSDPIPISIPKVKQTKGMLFLLFFEKYKEKFSIFKYLLGIINNPRFSSLSFFDDNQSGTSGKIVDCTITIEIHIIIYGPWVRSNNVSDVIKLAQSIEQDIENVWNKDRWSDGDGKPWHVQCDKWCNVYVPGCEVKFDVIVSYQQGEWYAPDGWHMIYIPEEPEEKSYITAWDHQLPRPNDGKKGNGLFNANSAPGVYAHEAGHLMGLKDQYIDSSTVAYDPEKGGWYTQRYTVPIPGEEGNIMAETNGKPDQDDINDIVASSGIKCPCKCCPNEYDIIPPENKIETPTDGSQVSNPIIVGGHADDGLDGSGVALLDYLLEWDDGSKDGSDYPIDPPEQYVSYQLGPINLDNYIDEGDWISITVFASDSAGNTGSDSVTVTWQEEPEDITPPVTEKIIGEPNEDGGYTIWPFTPITFEATDDLSGVDYIYYEVWWDSNEDGIVDMLMAEKTVFGNTVLFSVDMYGIIINTIELRWYAVDNADNIEEMHYQQHYVTT